MEKIARRLLRNSGLFGAKKDEKTSEINQQKTVMAWMYSLLFPDGLEVFTVNEFIRAYQIESGGEVISTQFFAAHLREILRHGAIADCNDPKATGLNSTSLEFIEENIFLPIMPTFYFNTVHDATMNYALGSVEWGFLHIGLGFAMSAEISLQSVSANELVSLGIFLDSMLREGLLHSSSIKLFMLPAMFYHVKSNLDKGIGVNTDDIFYKNVIKPEILENFF
ncbi:hypothetical protein ABK905_06920 [Acerihabitans sp. KWT182]|uniref:Uncharacterized protein n=1 Tax=Acerihabitans sp. KWT182 TaxID=3157919 RepID=A0AAU7QD73_9GAMM